MGLMAAICLIGLGSCATSTPPPQPDRAASRLLGPSDEEEDMVATGRMVVQQQCAGCHAIDQQTRSPHSEAPPMNTLLAAYDPERLTEDLIEGVRVGHDDMPLFDFNVRAADAVIAYLKSISERPIEEGPEER
jgi:mono/diheme cytochrome c family protein